MLVRLLNDPDIPASITSIVYRQTAKVTRVYAFEKNTTNQWQRIPDSSSLATPTVFIFDSSKEVALDDLLGCHNVVITSPRVSFV